MDYCHLGHLNRAIFICFRIQLGANRLVLFSQQFQITKRRMQTLSVFDGNPSLNAMGCSERIVRFEEVDHQQYFIVVIMSMTPLQNADTVRQKFRWAVEESVTNPIEKRSSQTAANSWKSYREEKCVKADFLRLNPQQIELINTLAMLLPAPFWRSPM